MNKYAISALTLAALMTTAMPVFADESPSPSPTRSPGVRQEFRKEVKEIRTETRQEIASRTQAFQAKLKEQRDAQRRDRITKFWKQTGNRLQKIIDREYGVADKIKQRIDRLETLGRSASDITKLRNDLASARAKIDAAKTALADATTQIDSLLNDNKAADALAKARELHKGVIGKIREAHVALIKVLASTRGLSVTPTPSPSSTPTPTPTP